MTEQERTVGGESSEVQGIHASIIRVLTVYQKLDELRGSYSHHEVDTVLASVSRDKMRPSQVQ